MPRRAAVKAGADTTVDCACQSEADGCEPLRVARVNLVRGFRDADCGLSLRVRVHLERIRVGGDEEVAEAAATATRRWRIWKRRRPGVRREYMFQL